MLRMVLKKERLITPMGSAGIIALGRLAGDIRIALCVKAGKIIDAAKQG